jgi:thiol-disulfide isomerase/thioredoxin
MRFGVRWLVVVAVVVVAAVLAVRPWTWHASTTATPPATTVSVPNIAAERTAAELPACASTAPNPKFASITVTCLADGKQLDFASLLSTGPVLVNTWATWCQPCQRELPALDAYAKQPQAIRVVGVQVRDDPGDALNLLAALHVHLPMATDRTGAAAKALGLVVGLPASYLVRPDGTVTLISQPRVFDDAGQVRATIERMLGTDGSARG